MGIIWFSEHLTVYQKQQHFIKRLEPYVRTSWFRNHFADHLNVQCCMQNLEELLWTPIDEKDGLRKTTSSTEGAVSVGGYAEDWVVPFSWHNQIWQS